MKKEKRKLTDIEKKSARVGLFLIFIAAITLEATSITQYVFSLKGIRNEASMRAESQMETTKARIMDVINQAEAAVRNSIWIAQWCLEVPDSMGRVTERIVKDNPVVVGSTVAFVPGYDKIVVRPETRFIGTMNYGYAGTRELNEALTSRFAVLDMPLISDEKMRIGYGAEHARQRHRPADSGSGRL